MTVQNDAEESLWEAAVAQAWETDWNDPREDIYTLEDGKPIPTFLAEN